MAKAVDFCYENWFWNKNVCLSKTGAELLDSMSKRNVKLTSSEFPLQQLLLLFPLN